jgi:hypothetical protein
MVGLWDRVSTLKITASFEEQCIREAENLCSSK